MIFATISSILMRRQEDVVTAPVDMVTYTVENAIRYYVYAKKAIVLTYIPINCKLYLNIAIVFDTNMCELKYFFASAPLKSLPFNTFYLTMLHKCNKLKIRGNFSKALTFLSYICSKKRKKTKSRIFNLDLPNVICDYCGVKDLQIVFK